MQQSILVNFHLFLFEFMLINHSNILGNCFGKELLEKAQSGLSIQELILQAMSHFSN